MQKIHISLFIAAIAFEGMYDAYEDSHRCTTALHEQVERAKSAAEREPYADIYGESTAAAQELFMEDRNEDNDAVTKSLSDKIDNLNEATVLLKDIDLECARFVKNIELVSSDQTMTRATKHLKDSSKFEDRLESIRTRFLDLKGRYANSEHTIAWKESPAGATLYKSLSTILSSK
ncbi:MAG: hypothetical protein M1821_004658 [Bathelium mastoideum]|nr:MAG: hypothetical protein M1821_004658 [Bathelium mastoideum]